MKSISKTKYKNMLKGFDKETLENVEALVYEFYHGSFIKTLDGLSIKKARYALGNIIDSERDIMIKKHLRTDWCILDENDEPDKINSERILEVVELLLLADIDKIEFPKRRGALFLSIKGLKKEFRISDDQESRKSKLVRFLSEPCLETPRKIDSVIENIRLSKDEPRSFTVETKKKLIENTLKEINRGLAKEKAPISFGLRWEKGFVSLFPKLKN